MKYETITLSKFLSRTLGLEGSDLKRITHLDAKTLFPDLKRSKGRKKGKREGKKKGKK